MGLVLLVLPTLGLAERLGRSEADPLSDVVGQRHPESFDSRFHCSADREASPSFDCFDPQVRKLCDFTSSGVQFFGGGPFHPLQILLHRLAFHHSCDPTRSAPASTTLPSIPPASAVHGPGLKHLA